MQKLSKNMRRDQVVNAVLELIGRNGVTGLSTAAIAKEVGMSEANLYRHFQNKQEILAETVKRIGEELRENVASVTARQLPPVNWLKEVFRLHLSYVRENQGVPRLVFSEEVHLNNDEVLRRLLETISSYATSLENIIVRGKEDGSIKQSLDANATALMFIGMVQVTILRWALSGFSLPIEDEGIALWNNFEACIRA